MKLAQISSQINLMENDEIRPHQVIDDSWEFKPHSQLGSNPGGLFIGPDGEKHYIKFYKNPKQVESEYAATKISSSRFLRRSTSPPLSQGVIVSIALVIHEPKLILCSC